MTPPTTITTTTYSTSFRELYILFYLFFIKLTSTGRVTHLITRAHISNTCCMKQLHRRIPLSFHVGAACCHCKSSSCALSSVALPTLRLRRGNLLGSSPCGHRLARSSEVTSQVSKWVLSTDLCAEAALPFCAGSLELCGPSDRQPKLG
jgi:hypothetical protein